MGEERKAILAVLGGDEREAVLANGLEKAGYDLRLFALDSPILTGKYLKCASLRDALEAADAVLLPVAGIDEHGLLYAKTYPKEVVLTKEEMGCLKEGTPVFTGVASQYLRNLGRELRLAIVPVANRDEIAIPNAVPTAEAAIAIAMDRLPITIHGAQCLVVGYGRVGEALSNTLKALGANVNILSRNAAERMKAWALGIKAFPFEEMNKVLQNADIVYNTVPALVLKKENLMQVRKDSLLIDLASKPGGFDFAAASDLGLTVMHALGLPGKHSPVTAGRILAEVYPALIEAYLP